MPTDFDKQEYWHQRFSLETSFEWLTSSDTFMGLVDPYLQPRDKSSRILQLGFGTSDLANHFRAQGFNDVTNADYEPLAIERGHELEAQAFGDIKMRYVVADATQLGHDLRDEKFDIIIDKSTVDAVSCAGESAFARMATSIRGCLAEGGIWVSMSYSAQRFQQDYLPFHVQVIGQVPTPKLAPNDPDVFHWCYLLRPR